MGFVLKSGLGKRVVHQVIADNYAGDFLPSVSQCTFKRLKNSYWLRFVGLDDVLYEVYLTSWDGEFRYFIDRLEYCEEDDTTWVVRFTDHTIPHTYLLEHKMLLEVS